MNRRLDDDEEDCTIIRDNTVWKVVTVLSSLLAIAVTICIMTLTANSSASNISDIKQYTQETRIRLERAEKDIAELRIMHKEFLQMMTNFINKSGQER